MPSACAPGDTEACACGPGAVGRHTCAADGSGYGACSGCTSTVDASSGCPGALVRCDGACVDVSLDSDHCGACSARCDASMLCLAGQCACPAGQLACDGSCFDLSSSVDHCGACATACFAGQLCSDGSCVCPAGQSACAGRCVDLATDVNNCSQCGRACGDNMACSGGHCLWLGTNIEHVVLIVQENHTFDSYFGRYCTAPAGSQPVCTQGRGCCEGAPASDGAGNPALLLTDAENYADDHDHTYACEVCEIDNGNMDRFTAGSCPSDPGFNPLRYSCSNKNNFEITADPALMTTYWGLADDYALADRYFQPIAGGTSSNDMYFAVTHYEFADNAIDPPARGAGCTQHSSPVVGTALHGRTTIADVLLDGGFSFKVYADGYADAYNAYPSCPAPGGTCRESFPFKGSCKYDPSDIPFQYYPQLTDDPAHMRDLTEIYTDLGAGSLPSFSYVKYRTSGNEHPLWSYISDGENNVARVINAIFASPYQGNTLVLLTWDEGGGFYDHIAPPRSVENYPASAGAAYAGKPIPYGARVPMLAVGVFARPGHVSHVGMEHSSIVAFLEWNFLGPDGVGALRATDGDARDGIINGIGSLLDATAVGASAP